MDYLKHQGVVIGLSERKDGQMKGNSPKLSAYFKDLGLLNKSIVSAGLVNGALVGKIDKEFIGNLVPACDALISNDDKRLLVITVADCAPIYFYDAAHRAVGLAHAGWRGILAGVARETVRAMVSEYGSSPAELSVFVGPHIRSCHFEVGADVAPLFEPEDIESRAGKIYVSLESAILRQLKDSGVSAGNINFSQECTYCAVGNRFSYRRDKPEAVEAMAAYIGLE